MITNILQNSTAFRQPDSQASSVDVTCEIQFTMEEEPQTSSSTNGQCWHDIFRNPVVVKGYPIPQRTEWNTGLEVSLNILAGLARTQRVEQFNERLCIKSFSMMLVPTKRNGDVLYWHLIYNKDGSRISYLDDCAVQEQHVSGLDLENLRHVLGWCSEAKSYAGKNYFRMPSLRHSLLT